jgi:dephospho-CoA kinase
MLKVGLTGSIAVGKSYVCSIFRELGCHVLDADHTARQVVEPGTVGLEQIVNAFGTGVLQPDGRLDRQKVGSIVFADRAKRNLLNSIVHPLVVQRQDEWIEGLTATDASGIAIVDAALMVESGGYKRFDQLIVVWCSPELQLQRLMRRDNIDEAQAEMRIAAQMSQDEKKKYADHLINTSDGFASTRTQVMDVFRNLRHGPEGTSTVV